METTFFKRWKDQQVILFLAILKLTIHFLTNTRYGLHRDEYLYFDEGKHLAWGFFEVPPITPFIGAIANVLGGSQFMIRLFPALAGVVIIIIACRLVIQLGGGRVALWITGLSLSLSPALLGSNTLFQPVSFNQLFWFLIAHQTIQIIREPKAIRWYVLGFLMGLAFLTKYSVAFYLFMLLLALLLSPHRKKMWSPHFLIGVFIALVLVLPNLYWQWENGLPVLAHMRELRETQLLHVSWPHFLFSQFRFHFAFSVVWIAGVIGLFRGQNYREYKYLAWALIGTILFIGALSGKAYYTAGAFLILFPFGGLFLEKWILQPSRQWGLMVGLFVFSLPVIPFSLPVLSLDSLKAYLSFLNQDLGIYYKQRWEDGQYYPIPQDIADMHGWEEMVQKVSKVYQQIPAAERASCMIYGGSYGHAGAINFFRKKYGLPQAQSLNSSYAFWADPNTQFDRQIMVDDVLNLESSWFSQMELVDSITDPNARDPGYIYWRQTPKIDVVKAWRELILERRGEQLGED
ncbi:MAG: glycosyltransferase family 39 protein [Saprospiraceae bacterium]|nr:glycosyltransferase family 39 protein [Saprospiraceae bacterium]